MTNQDPIGRFVGAMRLGDLLAMQLVEERIVHKRKKQLILLSDFQTIHPYGHMGQVSSFEPMASP